MSKVLFPKLEFSRELRKSQTPFESLLWSMLRSRRFEGFKFRRQHVIGPYIADFCCLNPKVIVELDGGQHAEREAYDKRRTAYLEKKGFKVIRVWNNESLDLTGLEQYLCLALTLPSTVRGPGEGNNGPSGGRER
jgi:very-short-patch-repair endonuclease